MKKALMLLAMVMLLATSAATHAKDVMELSVTTVMAPTDPTAQSLHHFAKKLDEISGGTMKVTVYDNGQLFNQLGDRAAAKQGMVDMIYLAPAFIGDELPYSSMFVSAYLFDDYDHMNNFYKSEAAQKLFDDVANATGLRPLTTFYQGTREITLREYKDVKTPEDLKGIKMRMPNSPSWLALGSALGTSPTPLDFSDVYMGLKTGTIDAQDNPLSTTYSSKFYEVAESIALTDHVIWHLWPSINKEKWEAMSEQQKAWLNEAILAGKDFCDTAVLKMESDLVSTMEETGIKFQKPDLDAFRAYARKYYEGNKEITKDWNWELYEMVRNNK